ncbi:cytochrome P450 [Xylariaceae sp. FL0594]|nr:cytochrome P450 [Xylariaceae sp. FL0594]
MPRITFPAVLAFATLSSYPLARAGPGDRTYVGALCQVLPLCIALWVVYRFLIYPNLLSPLRHLPTVDGGSWWSPQSLRLASEPRGVPQCDWLNKIPHEGHGLIRYRSLFNTERVVPASPEALAEVLTTKSYLFEKPPEVVAALTPFAGVGVLLSEGDQHRLQRKTLMPAFAYRHIKELYGLMWEVSCNDLASLTEEVTTSATQNIGRPVEKNIHSWANRTALDIIFVAGIGQDSESVRNGDSNYTTVLKIYETLFTPTKQDFILFPLRRWVLPGWLYELVPLPRRWELAKAAKTLRQTCRQILRKKKEDLENELADETDKDILTVALSYGGFTEDELIEQLVTFLAAGHETTATALTWAVYALSKHPDMQKRLREEIRAHLPSPSTSPSASSPDTGELATVIDHHMPYLQAVCAEVLRFYAPVPVTYREGLVDTTIQGTRIPAGTPIVLCPRAINRNMALWGEDADVFKPERYLQSKNGTANSDKSDNSNGGTRSNYATMTFLHGPRSCIGQSFAKAELAILIAVLFGRFEFSLANESQRDESRIPLRRGATNRPVGGMPVKMSLVEGW